MITVILIAVAVAASVPLAVAARRYLIPVTSRQQAGALADAARASLTTIPTAMLAEPNGRGR